MPANYRGALPNLMARLEPLPVSMGGQARIVINERTGTVVVGNEVRLGRTAVAHGNLSVRISTKYNVSQPNPFSPPGARRWSCPTRRSTSPRPTPSW